MSDPEILDKGETLVALTPCSLVDRRRGANFETITYVTEVRCDRCGNTFPISISDLRSDGEAYSKTAGWPLVELLEFNPYCCPHCCSKIAGIHAYITGGD